MVAGGQHPGLSAYRAALRLPGAAAFSAAGALARLPQAMVGLGSVLLLTGLDRSYTLAGLVAGVVSLAQGVASHDDARRGTRAGTPQDGDLRSHVIRGGDELSHLFQLVPVCW